MNVSTPTELTNQGPRLKNNVTKIVTVLLRISLLGDSDRKGRDLSSEYVIVVPEALPRRANQ